MALTDPFPAGVEDWLRDSIVHLYRVTVIPNGQAIFDVAVDDRLDVTFDAEWSPYCQASIRIKTPTDPAQLAALDARLGTRLEIRAGYRYAGTDYLPYIARLRLQSARTPQPGGTTDLTAMGLEMMLQEQGSIRESENASSYTDRSGVVPYLRSWINRMYEPGPKPALAVTVPDGAWKADLVAGLLHSGGTNWSAMEGVARAAGVRVYDTGLEQWRIDPAVGAGGLSTDCAARLRTGRTGTVTTADVRVDRREWFNAVDVEFWWTSAPDAPIPNTRNSLLGTATVTSGPLRVTTLNRKEYRDSREQYVSQGYATAYAQSLLRTLMLRGRYRELTAVAAYWLRPGMTVLTKFDRANYRPVLVSAVTFSPLTGSMAVRTIRPEDYEVT